MSDILWLDPELRGALGAVGVKKLTDLLCYPAEDLASRAAVPLPAVLDAFEQVYARCAAHRRLASDVGARRALSVETGCAVLDKVISSSYALPGSIIEISGRSGCGKSQLAMTIAAKAACRGGSVLFVDSGGNFSGLRLADIVRRVGDGASKPSECLERVAVRRCFRPGKLCQLLREVLHQRREKTFAVEQEDAGVDIIDILAVDSLASLCQPLLGPVAKQGLSPISQISRLLTDFAKEAQCWVIVVNHHVDADDKLWKPALGKVWSYAPAIHISLTDVTDDELVTDGIEADVHGSGCTTKRIALRIGDAGILGMQE